MAKERGISDGVSSLNKSWYEIIQETLETNDTIVKKEMNIIHLNIGTNVL